MSETNTAELIRPDPFAVWLPTVNGSLLPQKTGESEPFLKVMLGKGILFDRY